MRKRGAATHMNLLNGKRWQSKAGGTKVVPARSGSKVWLFHM